MKVDSSELSDDFLSLTASKFRILGDETRLAILRDLMDVNEANVTEIVDRTGRRLANVSKHLKLLSDRRILSRRQEGTFVFYKLDDPLIRKICALVCESLQRDLKAELLSNAQMLQRKW